MPLHTTADTPLGPLTLVVDDAGALAGLYYPDHSPAPRPGTFGERVPPNDGALAPVVAALAAYLGGRARTFDVATAQQAGTRFQHAVWERVSAIEAGTTCTYAEVAEAVGHPAAHRAVGAALARNAVCLAVPCHRVLASGGRITGYAGGVERKRWLLDLEAGRAPQPLLSPVTPAPPPPPGARP